MHNFFLGILKYILKKLAQATLWRYHPGLVGITGSAGKTSAKEAVKVVLARDRRVRASRGNFNNEIGLPLTILGDWGEIPNPLFWLKVVLVSLLRLISPFKMPYPEILILEYGVDKPHDMDYLLRIARPSIAVVTAIGEVPVHVEFFSGPEALAREKAKLVNQLPSIGFAVLSADDVSVVEMRNETRAHVITYGFSEKAEMIISGFENRSSNWIPLGLGFKLEYGGAVIPVKLDGIFGKSQAYSAAAASSLGLIFGMNLVKIAEALADYKPPNGRLKLLGGVKESFILDDTYNASPVSMHTALETLRDLKAKRKVAILGDMLEIGKYSPEAHEATGRIAAKIADLIVTVGPRAKFIAEAARESGFKRDHIYSFSISDEAKKPVESLIKSGDLILVKGSQAMRMEKIVKEIMAEPDRARELLVRQSPSWQRR